MIWPWLLLALYGVGLYLISPRTRSGAGFFSGTSDDGRQVGTVLLAGSVLITWIFAKSITNAANLGAAFGIVGGVAYAGYYLSIPFAGWVLGSLRRTLGARSLSSFLVGRFGRAAGAAFLLAILIRLYNEVWSNTLVVATYFGDRGSAAFWIAVAAFTGVTLAYSLKGGMRSSLITDAVQLALTGFLLAVVWFAITPRTGVRPLLTSGEWTLVGGVDLLLVALLQMFSYPFHDPVLTDRAFIAPVATVRRAFNWAGAAGVVLIVMFSGLGIFAFLNGLEVAEDAPRVAAQAMGVGTLLAVNVLILASAGSTIDSTFSAVAKLVARDATDVSPWWERAVDGLRELPVGRAAMVAAALLGSLPLLADATILQATTISGTMVIGLGPVICLYWLGKAPPASFHLSFWTGLGVGVALVAGWWPAALHIGSGSYADLLGANVYGLAAVTAGYLVPLAVARARGGGGPGAPAPLEAAGTGPPEAGGAS